MNPALSAIPAARRRRAATALALIAALFTAVGVVSLSGDGAALTVFGVIALLVAAVDALAAWGLRHSVRIELAEQSLDRVIEDALAASGQDVCGCGHDHDPDELHVRCPHGNADGCERDCDTCVLAGLRPGADDAGVNRAGD